MIKKLLLSSLLALSFMVGFSAEADLNDPVSEVARIEFSVYPNPSNGVFYLRIEDYSSESFQVKVVDLIGNELTSRTVSPNEEVIFDLSTAPKGIYFVKITRGQDQIVKRLVIQ